MEAGALPLHRGRGRALLARPEAVPRAPSSTPHGIPLNGISAEIVLTLGITLVALGLFLWNRLPVEVVGVTIMTLLLVSGLVTHEEGLSGFANEATVIVALILVLSAGLIRTGVIDVIGRWAGRLARGSEFRLVAVIVLLVVPVSAFLNNTAVVAILLPTVLGLTRSMKVAPSRVLMPLSFSSQLGGTLTLVGTSTNLLVAGLVLGMGMDRIRLFDITPAALVLTTIGVVYLLTLGRWLTPVRTVPNDLLLGYELRDYLTGLEVEPRSRLAGRTLAETRFGQDYGLHVVGIEREGKRLAVASGETVLRRGDLLLVEGKIPDIAQIEELDGLRIAGTRPPLPEWSAAGEDGQGEEGPRLAEVLIPPRSHAVGNTVRSLGFRTRYGVSALAIQRHGQPIHEKLGRIVLEPGDILLVQGTAEALSRIHRGGELALLGQVDLPAKRRRKLRIAVPIMIGVMLLPALGLTSLLISALLGVLAMFLTGCITPAEAYEEMDWSVIILLGSILPLGVAMQKTGTAELLAGGFVSVTSALGPHGILGAFYLMTSLLTAVISNNAAAVVLIPMAVSTARTLELDPMPFAVAVMFAASNSFETPIGYQTNTFIYGPGGYRFSDFARVGAPLTLLLVTAATFVIPFFFPFRP